ncbi:unnamed protein product [Cercospora beticola]|nr:unnamed protein product [Cercospora beticola]
MQNETSPPVPRFGYCVHWQRNLGMYLLLCVSVSCGVGKAFDVRKEKGETLRSRETQKPQCFWFSILLPAAWLHDSHSFFAKCETETFQGTSLFWVPHASLA